MIVNKWLLPGYEKLMSWIWIPILFIYPVFGVWYLETEHGDSQRSALKRFVRSIGVFASIIPLVFIVIWFRKRKVDSDYVGICGMQLLIGQVYYWFFR